MHRVQFSTITYSAAVKDIRMDNPTGKLRRYTVKM